MVEAACPELDASATATTTAADLPRLLYIFAKLQPHTRCSNLRVKSYKALMKLVSKAAERVGKHLQHDFVLNSMMFDGELKADKIAEAARSKGFQDEWLTGPVKKKKSSDGGKKQACLTETLSLTLTMSASMCQVLCACGKDVVCASMFRAAEFNFDEVRKRATSLVCGWGAYLVFLRVFCPCPSSKCCRTSWRGHRKRSV